MLPSWESFDLEQWDHRVLVMGGTLGTHAVGGTLGTKMQGMNNCLEGGQTSSKIHRCTGRGQLVKATGELPTKG